MHPLRGRWPVLITHDTRERTSHKRVSGHHPVAGLSRPGLVDLGRSDMGESWAPVCYLASQFVEKFNSVPRACVTEYRIYNDEVMCLTSQ